MDERHEYDELARETRAGRSGPRGGCGCLAWVVVLLFFLLVGGKSIGVWRPLLLLTVFLALTGLALWALFKAMSNAKVRRGRYDPGNEDWHPLSVVRNARRGRSNGPAGAEAPVPLPQASPAPAAVDSAARPEANPQTELVAASSSLTAAPPDVGVGDVPEPAGLPYEPQAPQAPEAPASPWS